jgi:hypothetical protein
MEELPALIDTGLAVMLTVGAGAEDELLLLKVAPPQPERTRKIGSANSIASGEKMQLSER